MFSRALFISLTLLLSGCARPSLDVYTSYLTRQNLASCHVRTPDPLLNCPPMGQQLIISWSIPKSWLCDESLHLEIEMRMWNREIEVLRVPVRSMMSYYIVPVINQKYFDTKGIATYKVSMIGSDGVLQLFQHQLWAEWIAPQE